VGSRVAIVNAPDDAVLLRPPPPGPAIADVGAAVRDALRFPLAEQPLDVLARRAGAATIVVEPPALPLPGAQHDPRQAALAAASEELERLGVGSERQTLLVTAGLARRPDQRMLEALVSPEFRRRFRGRVEAHDVEDPDLVDVDGWRLNRALVETDVVVCVSAAETVVNGGPAVLLAAGAAAPLRRASSSSLLETHESAGWELAVELERALGTRVPVVGVSLALNHPRVGGALRGFPYEPEAAERIAGSPLRFLFGALPGPLRGRVLHSLPLELTVGGVFAGPPSVAHAEALLRGIEARSTPLQGALDAVCLGIPRSTPYLPRERPNPLTAAYLGLGHALRLWRDSPPLAEGGTVVLAHRFHRHFAHPTQQPYRGFFHAMRAQREPAHLERVESEVRIDERAIAEYRGGRTCHPLLPFAEWAACQPALQRAGTVLVAGCRDATAARQLGFVPTRGIGAALELVRGQTGPDARVGFLLSPPYFPLTVAPSDL